MENCDQSSTSDNNASMVSAESEPKLLINSDEATCCIVDPPLVVALETTNEETSKVEFSEDEEMLIAKMFNLVGQRWSLIAGRIPGRSADEIEKYWNSKYSKNREENLPEIPIEPKDRAEGIGLKEASGYSTEEIKGQQ